MAIINQQISISIYIYNILYVQSFDPEKWYITKKWTTIFNFKHFYAWL